MKHKLGSVVKNIRKSDRSELNFSKHQLKLTIQIMKKSLVILLFCGSLLFVGQTAVAQNSGIGVGAMINTPTGLSVKAWINDDLAIDGAMTFNLGENFSQFYFHGNALLHQDTDHPQLQYFYGLGARFNWTDIGNDLIVGIRGPGGITYQFDESNIESFFEIAPTIDFTPDFRFFFGGAVGMRVYLN